MFVFDDTAGPHIHSFGGGSQPQPRQLTENDGMAGVWLLRVCGHGCDAYQYLFFKSLLLLTVSMASESYRATATAGCWKYVL